MPAAPVAVDPGSSSSFSIAFLSSFSTAQPCCCSQAVSRATWLIPVTAPPVISASSASISGAAAWAMRRAASANSRSTQKPRSLIVAAQLPQLLLRGRQRWQPLDRARARPPRPGGNNCKAARAVPDHRTNRCRRGPRPCAAGAASTSGASTARRQRLFDCPARAHRAAELNRAGNPQASAIAMVQRWRSSGMSGQPKRGASRCCSIAVSKLIVVGDDDPGRVVRGFNEFRRHWIAWGPQLHWARHRPHSRSTENARCADQRRNGMHPPISAHMGCVFHNPDEVHAQCFRAGQH